MRELMDKNGKIGIEFLRKRQKPGAEEMRRASQLTTALGGGALSVGIAATQERCTASPLSRCASLASLLRSGSAGPKFARTRSLLTTQHVDKMRFHRHILMTCRHRRHIRRSIRPEKEASACRSGRTAPITIYQSCPQKRTSKPRPY
ncbi:hypothetical protein EHS39_32140 [Ensifer sp. MPMI2T]|nr:hypothetical protein EHS39_32140 [Ensifer sp. MPMI2T]